MMTALGVGLFALLAPDTPLVQLVIFRIIAGAGMGPLFQAPIIAIQAAVSQADTAAATSTFGFLRNVATSVSPVIEAVVFQNGMEDRLVSMVDIGISQEVIAALSNVMMTDSISDPMQREVVEAAFAWSLRHMWIMFGGIAGLGTIASVFASPAAPGNRARGNKNRHRKYVTARFWEASLLYRVATYIELPMIRFCGI